MGGDATRKWARAAARRLRLMVLFELPIAAKVEVVDLTPQV
jgi:hypothetical protein